MLFHSIVPREALYQPQTMQASCCKKCRYGYVEGRVSDGKFTIDRVISTDPQAYLDPTFSPGMQLMDSTTF